MKFYSEKLRRIFNTTEELEKAEMDFDNKQNKSEKIKKKYKDIITSIVDGLNELINIDQDEELSDENEEELVTYFIQSVFPLLLKIRTI